MLNYRIKYLFLWLVAVAIPRKSMATPQYQYGAVAGIAASSLYNIWNLRKISNTASPKASQGSSKIREAIRFSLHGGAYLEYIHTPHYGGGMELSYLSLGIPHPDFEVLMSYINIPFYVTYYPWENGPLGFSIHGGVAANFLWNIERLKIIKFQIEENTPSGSIKPLEPVFIGGAQYRWDNDIFINIRCGRGILNIFREKSVIGIFLKHTNLFNMYVQLSVGYNLAPMLQHKKWPSELKRARELGRKKQASL